MLDLFYHTAVAAGTQEPAESGKVFKIMTIKRRPFMIVSQGEFSGFSINLWKQLAGSVSV